MITELQPHQIIVVGTNEKGHHAGGAAAQAYRDFGALYGLGRESIGGQSYGIVTLDSQMNQVPLGDIGMQVAILRGIALLNPHKEFLLTKIGCGIAGFDEKDIKPLFKSMPDNVVLPEDWK